MQLAIDIRAEAGGGAISALDFSALGPDDYLNLILQRSEVMFDIPKSGQVIRAWEAGDMGPISRVIADMGEDIARRAAGVIHAEYRTLAPLIAARGVSRLADIGCGYALFDLFVARDNDCDLLLIDLEVNDRRNFGFAEQGAAYSNLSVARKILENNGISSDRIVTLNPRDAAPEAAGPVDFAVSFLSCGFHYPVDAYLPFVDQALVAGGTAVFDLRAATAEAQANRLAAFGAVTDLAAPKKARRVQLVKEAA